MQLGAKGSLAKKTTTTGRLYGSHDKEYTPTQRDRNESFTLTEGPVSRPYRQPRGCERSLLIKSHQLIRLLH